MSTNADWIAREQTHAFEVYPKRDLVISTGKGARLWDIEGREYIDCAAGIGVANIGHCHPAVIDAIHQQSQELITCAGVFYNDVRANLFSELARIAPSGLNRSFLCNSGTEAVEAALKFARITTGKNGFVSAMRGFHGRSMGALSATFKYRQEFEPLIPGHDFVPFNNLEKLTEKVDANTAAVLLELVQGEGGVRPADREYVSAVQDLCRREKVLLIVDEIQTGFGRTGKMFACQTYDIQPDLMTVAKAMAGGLPMGAVLCSDDIASAAGKHGSTFGGNPLVCAAALATIRSIEAENLPQRAQNLGERFRQRFSSKAPEIVREIRQLGLMIGIELKTKSRPYLLKLLERGVIALPAGPTVIRLLPPLVISEDDMDTVCDELLDVLSRAEL
ncbi:MAG: acetylornithine/succinylornithine family transaminase [Pseudomonadota bacterium]